VSLADDFNEFMARYPRRVARIDAEKAYIQMRRKPDMTKARIHDGLERYLQNLPDQMCFIPYPASWIRAGRFDDEYETAVPAPAKVDWYAECQQTHNGECGLSQQRHAQRVWNEAYKERERSA
jgi:hypothetical protein